MSGLPKKYLFALLYVTSFLLSDSIKAQSPLCASRPTSFCCEYVSSVTINGKTFKGSTGFSASSGGSPAGYYDYAYTKDTVPSIKAGQSITISYTGVTNGNYMQYFKLWIDFNGNGVLTDAGELVHAQNQSWVGTRTMSYTFTVPTSVYNGEVYMRFVMQFSGSPVICGTYAYGNTFDFKTKIVGATDPFSFSGKVLNSEEKPISNIPIELYSKLKSSSTYAYESVVYTDATGSFKASSKNAASLYDFQIKIPSLTVQNPSTTDATSFNQKIMGPDNFTARDYYRMDPNGNGRFTISDIFLTFMRSNGRSWPSGTPTYRIFTKSEFSTIKSSSSDLRSTIPGSSTYTQSGLTNKDSVSLYIIRSGYRE
jgi:hypothetical protein